MSLMGTHPMLRARSPLASQSFPLSFPRGLCSFLFLFLFFFLIHYQPSLVSSTCLIYLVTHFITLPKNKKNLKIFFGFLSDDNLTFVLFHFFPLRSVFWSSVFYFSLLLVLLPFSGF